MKYFVRLIVPGLLLALMLGVVTSHPVSAATRTAAHTHMHTAALDDACDPNDDPSCDTGDYNDGVGDNQCAIDDPSGDCVQPVDYSQMDDDPGLDASGYVGYDGCTTKDVSPGVQERDCPAVNCTFGVSIPPDRSCHSDTVSTVITSAPPTVGPPGASPSATCSGGSSCNGKQPVDSGCYSGAYIPNGKAYTVPNTNIVVALYYSPACNAYYTYVRSNDGARLLYPFVGGDQWTTINRGGNSTIDSYSNMLSTSKGSKQDPCVVFIPGTFGPSGFQYQSCLSSKAPKKI